VPKLSEKRKELLTAMMKEAIYDAAVAVLGKHGVGGMTMDRVAAAANLAKGSLYNYFDDKQDLLRFVYGKIIDPVSEAIAETAGEPLPAAQKLESILHTLFDHFRQHRRLLSLFLGDDAARAIIEPARKCGRAAALRHLVAVFSQGIAERSFRAVDPEVAGRLLLGGVSEIFLRHLVGPLGESNKSIEEIMALFLHGVAAEPAVGAP
jgi:AcrR family transcriptional regulator